MLVPMNVPLRNRSHVGHQAQAPCDYTVPTALTVAYNAGVGRDAGIRTMWF